MLDINWKAHTQEPIWVSVISKFWNLVTYLLSLAISQSEFVIITNNILWCCIQTQAFPYFLSMNSLRKLFAALAKQFRPFIFVLFSFVLFFSISFFNCIAFVLFCFFFLKRLSCLQNKFFCGRLLACWWNTSAVTMKIKSLKSYFGIMTFLYRFDFW